MREEILEAVQARREIKLVYEGQERLVDPHCFGRNKLGNDVVRAYQHGPASGWRLFRLDRIGKVEDTGLPFVPQPTYRRDDATMESIYEQV